MKTKKLFWLFATVSLFLSACNSKPKFINHPAPNLNVSFDVFSGEVPRAALGCDEMQPTSNLLGGLEPSYPIAICVIYNDPTGHSAELTAEIETGQFFYYTGGLVGDYVRYVIHRNGEFVLLKTEEDFREVFAPIASPEEALSYVLAVRNLSAYYGLEYLPGYEYEVGTIEDTYVSQEAGSYRVRLFYDQVFGCGPHWTSAVDVRVFVEGAVEEISREAIFRDPNLDEVCVD
ncbi:MAG: hypothetical protein IT314_10850 [Anaerolineales bacterium]|nr:hypothetical protein [Anaerolineales bacterium]